MDSLCTTSNLNRGSINVKFCITCLLVLTSVTTCIICSISIGKCSIIIYESSENSLTQKPKIIFLRKSFCTFFMSQLKAVFLWEAFIWNPLSGYNALPMCSIKPYHSSHYIQVVAWLLFVCFAYPPKLQIWNVFHIVVSTISKSVFIINEKQFISNL